MRDAEASGCSGAEVNNSPPRSRSPLPTCLVRLGILLLVMMGVLTAVSVLYLQWLNQNSIVRRSEIGNLNPAEALYLQFYLANHKAELQQPAGGITTSTPFVIEPGQLADEIASQLHQINAIDDIELFQNYVRYTGMDSQLEAGDFTLVPGLTIPELAIRLTRANAEEIDLTFIEGWRMEEMVDYLTAVNPALINPKEFRAIAKRQLPFTLIGYDFLASLPPAASLEGFLFPDTYSVPADADATYLIGLMLQNFGNRVTPAMRQAYGVQGLSLREAVALASIVEREAVLAQERPLIAGVFYNRMAQGIMLQADPTIQYPLGYQPESDTWWKSPLSVDDLQLQSPYNTYLVEGLPPSPIANPGLSSLQAVAEPITTDFIFFVADCTAVGSHLFSVTYEEHLANVQNCR